MVGQNRWLRLSPALISALLIASVFMAVRIAGAIRTTLGVTASAGAGNGASSQNPPQALVGITRLHRLLGGETPLGTGIIAGHVEGVSGDYMPSIHAETLGGVRLVAISGASRINDHATATASLIYGPNGMAPGIGQVHHYHVADFLGREYLRFGSTRRPGSNELHLFNHSWIGQDRGAAAEVLMRLDDAIDTHDVVMVVGVDNGRSSRVPALLASAYNAIAVGQWDGDSSGGYTRLETPGRCKPDIVGPGSRTSLSTPVVTAVVARLLEAARAMTEHPHAMRAELIKAVLLAGATKPGNWRPAGGKPLDEHLGAGRADAVASHAILAAGPLRQGGVMPSRGWCFDQLPAGGSRTFSLHLPRHAGELSLVLVWHRRVDDLRDVDRSNIYWSPRPRVADFDLELVRVDEVHRTTAIAGSASRIDNVEHIHRTGVDAGLYRVNISRCDRYEELWDYALAWRIEDVQTTLAAR